MKNQALAYGFVLLIGGAICVLGGVMALGVGEGLSGGALVVVGIILWSAAVKT